MTTNREELIKFIVWAIGEIEGVEVTPEFFDEFSNEKLEEKAEWFSYLLDK